jgi:serine/threonine protein phosphatase PrpC
VLVGFVTDRGGSKKENEDSFLVDVDKGLFIVADGLGGHNAGKCASSIATEEIGLYLKEHLFQDQDEGLIMNQAVLTANSAIVRAAEADPEWRSDMGSTVVVALIKENRFTISNVGDSRAYLIKNGSIEQLSVDHTFVAEWVKDGTITAEEARNHEARRGLWMALGVEGDVEPYITEGAWNGDSCLLLCSDGLTDVVEDHDLLGLVRSAKDPQVACENLLRRAKELGTRDHVTVVLVCGDC